MCNAPKLGCFFEQKSRVSVMWETMWVLRAEGGDKYTLLKDVSQIVACVVVKTGATQILMVAYTGCPVTVLNNHSNFSTLSAITAI